MTAVAAARSTGLVKNKIEHPKAQKRLRFRESGDTGKRLNRFEPPLKFGQA
jgi:hypothetical protein